MQQKTIALVAGAFLLTIAGGLAALGVFGNDSVVHWKPGDEVEIAAPTNDAVTAEPATAQRSEVAVEQSARADNDSEPRIEARLHGRVVNSRGGAVADAQVFLDFSRGNGLPGRGGRGGPGGPGGPGNRQLRVPEPVVTDAAGKFAFQGQLFRNVRLVLQVAPRNFAPAVHEKTLDSKADMDLGDLVVTDGAEVLGRVTDLDGNAIPGAAIDVQPQNNNTFRWVRNREQLLPKLVADANGMIRMLHVAPGDWRLNASAPHYQDGNTPTFTAEDDHQVELEDIKLGPGFELAGAVHDLRGQPVAKAEVVFSSGRGQDHRTETDNDGHFKIDRLPGALLELGVTAKGFLDFAQAGIDAKLGAPVHVTLQDGLKIVGSAVDAATGAPVVRFAVAAQRVGNLPRTAAEEQQTAQVQASIEQAMRTARESGATNEAEMAQLRVRMEQFRAQMRAQGGDGGGRGRGPGGQGWQNFRGPGGPGGFGGFGQLGKPEDHPNGRFELSGLQEGMYVVMLQSPDHTRFRSAEVELRLGALPDVNASLDGGISISGVVRTQKGEPVADARVELRRDDANPTSGRGGRGGRNGGGQVPAPPDNPMGRMMRQFGGGGPPIQETTTDKAGRFVLAHAPRGTQHVSASAPELQTTSSEPMEMTADVAGIELALGLLGAVEGSVLGYTAQFAGEARVLAVPVTMQTMNMRDNQPTAPVREDGTYRIDNLPPGGYAVRAFLGNNMRQAMGSIMPKMMDGSLTADATVAGGDTTRWDVTLELPQTGTVVGMVTENGNPAKDFQVALARVDDNGNQGNQGNGGRNNANFSFVGGPGGGMLGGSGGRRNFSATVTAEGTYSMKDVEAGNYQLTVTVRGRRGGPLWSQPVTVVAQVENRFDAAVATCSLAGNFTTDDGTDAATLAGSVSLLPGLTEMPADWQAYRRDNQPPSARLQNGVFQFERVSPGNYLLVANLRGRERVLLQIALDAGRGQQLTLAAGKKSAPPAAPNPANPNPANTGAPNQPGGRGN